MGYWEDGDFLLYNYLTNSRTRTTPAVLAVLDALDAPVEEAELTRALDGAGAMSILQKLVDQDVLLVEGSPADRGDAAVSRWKWGQDARFFHFSTQHVTYERSGARQAEALRAHAAETPPPSPFKAMEGERSLPLADPSRAGREEAGLWDVLSRRRTVRELARTPITFEQLSTIVRWTWGATSVVRDPEVGTHLLKTSPSGGARHPIEVYPLVLRVAGVEPGLYHYAVESDALEPIRRGYAEDLALEICAGQPWIGDSAAVFFMTAVLERSMWKYDHSRTYRILLMDAGHLGQTFHLVCTSLGLGPVTTAATQDRLLQEALGIDGSEEIPLYTAAVGRPRD